MRREVSAIAGGGVRLRLSAVERDRLAELAQLLAPLLAEGDTSFPTELVEELRRKLVPAAYTDALEEGDHGEPLRLALQQERAHDVATFARTLAGGRVRGRAWSTSLDGDEARAWLSATNGARVVLAQLVGIGDESDWDRVADDPDPAVILLGYLGLLQEELVTALTAALELEEGGHI